MADTTGTSLSYADTFLRAVALARVLERELGPEEHVGVFVPPSVPGAVANLALALLGKIPVNLNYTASQAVLDSSIDQAGITHVLTSRRRSPNSRSPRRATLIFLEDIPKQVTQADKVIGRTRREARASCRARCVPARPEGESLDETATVIFTSGSTGRPEGGRPLAPQHPDQRPPGQPPPELLPDEVVLGILPFFHSFGFTVTIWTVLCLGKRVGLPLQPARRADHRQPVREAQASTLIAGTPTFMRPTSSAASRSSSPRCGHLLLGAEKLKPELADDIREKLGIEPLEGYGCTELSPVVSVNVPTTRPTRDGRTVPGNRPGTVGMPAARHGDQDGRPRDRRRPAPGGRGGRSWSRGRR